MAIALGGRCGSRPSSSSGSPGALLPRTRWLGRAAPGRTVLAIFERGQDAAPDPRTGSRPAVIQSLFAGRRRGRACGCPSIPRTTSLARGQTYGPPSTARSPPLLPPSRRARSSDQPTRNPPRSNWLVVGQHHPIRAKRTIHLDSTPAGLRNGAGRGTGPAGRGPAWTVPAWRGPALKQGFGATGSAGPRGRVTPSTGGGHDGRPSNGRVGDAVAARRWRDRRPSRPAEGLVTRSRLPVEPWPRSGQLGVGYPGRSLNCPRPRGGVAGAVHLRNPGPGWGPAECFADVGQRRFLG